MIMARDSNNNYVKIEDIITQQNNFNGISPIKFKSSGENLENYRIYGNTVGGESVGDRTTNLFDENSESIPGYLNDGGAIATVPNYPISTYGYINVLPNTNYSYKAFINASPNDSTHKTIRVSYYTNSKVFISRYFEIDKGLTGKTITTPNNCFYVRLSIDDNLRNVMLWRGSSDVSVYEPYGYRVPVMVSNGTDTQIVSIYLPEQIRKVDDEAEYIDFEEQKQHFADGTSVDVTLPALPTLSGTNTLSVETNTKPSKVWGKLSGPRDILYVKDNLGNILFSKYHEIEGESPLTYNAKKAGYLTNYRIYGQTVDGESVGDRTENLFDGNFLQGYWAIADGAFISANNWVCSSKLPCAPNTTYTSKFSTLSRWYGYVWFDIDGNYISSTLSQESATPTSPIIFTATSPSNAAYFGFDIAGATWNTLIHPEDVTDLMIVEGSTALPYEPYGYKVPVTVSNDTDTLTTLIYLPEPIKMIGDEAEYVDYAEQKWHRVRKNLLKITYASAGTTTYDGVSISNNDGILTLNGTSNNGAFINLATAIKLPIGNYILTGGSENPMIRFQKTFSGYGYDDTGAGRNFICPEEVTSGVCSLKLTANYTYNNVKVYPMIRKADITDDTYEPYIENTDLDVTLPALPTFTGTNVLSVGTAVQPSKVYLKGKLKRTIYGWHVDPDISDSSNAVTYLKDAIGMTPASMGSSTFDYGSWENAFFMPKPCMLKSNGKVDYYLDPNDYTKKLDGTASDISNPNYDGNAMMQWPKIWFKYVKGVKEGQGYFYVANYKADGNYHCWCNYDSEDNEIDHFYTAIYNGTSFMNYSASKTYVVNDFAVYDNKLYKCNTAITTAQAFDNTKWDLVSNTAPVINKIRSLSGVRLTNNNGNAQTTTTTEVTRATANNTTSAAEWYIETFSDRLLINGLLVLMGKSLNTQAVFGRGLDTGGQSAKEAYVTGTLNDKGLFWGVIENGNSGVKVFGMENFWGCCWHRVAGLITDNHVVKLKLTYGTKDGSTVIGYNQTGNGYIDNGTEPYSTGSIQKGFIQKMSYNKYGFMPAAIADESQSTYYADYYYQQNVYYTGIIYALFGGDSASSLGTGAFYLYLSSTPSDTFWGTTASLSCKPLLN